MTKPGAQGPTMRAMIAFVVVLAIASLGVGLYALAAGLPAPTISSAPANPTNQTSASFTYTDKNSITRFECSLDSAVLFGTCGMTRPYTKNYPGPLAPGSHTFRVRAVSGSQTSPVTSYTWTIDTTPPHVVTINRAGPNPTNAGSVSWTVTFSESVTGVDAGDFTLTRTGLGGISIVTSVSGSGATYTVTASTGIGVGTIRLNLVDNDSIKDLAGNKLGGTGVGNGNFTGQMYSIDKIPPPEPHFTQTPPNPSSTAVSTFAWTDSEPGVSFQCKIESAGAWLACAGPYTFTVSNTSNGQHQFAVRAVDAAGNISPPESYSWKVSQVGFTIAGVVTDFSAQPASLYPGVWRRIKITFTNPNSFSITITSLTVSASSSPAGCPASTNIGFNQSPLSTSHTFTVPAHSSAILTPADDPQIQLMDLPVNQDICKNKTFGLQFGGMAQH